MRILDYYKEHGIMTEVKTMKPMITDIPKNIDGIVGLTRNILLHQHWAQRYGVILTEERNKEPFLRSFEEKLSALNQRGFTHIAREIPFHDKLVGICRDFSVVSAALCIEAGIPARARCGFATYFEPGKYIDHWVLEYWDDKEERWIMTDAQIDAFQQKELGITFDPMHVGEEYFIPGPKAWKMCREGLADPKLFGIFEWWGYAYLNCNLILDVNSLLKVPMQPWDRWRGYKESNVEDWSREDYETLDQLAEFALNVDDDLDGLRRFVEKCGSIKVPDDLSQVKNTLL